MTSCHVDIPELLLRKREEYLWDRSFFGQIGLVTHGTDRSGRIGLAQVKKVIAYMLFHSPAKDLRYAAANHINRQRLHFNTLRISAFQI